MNRSCETCGWWDDNAATTNHGGFCRKNPPLVVASKEDFALTWWPETFADDWCGEHRATVPRKADDERPTP